MDRDTLLAGAAIVVGGTLLVGALLLPKSKKAASGVANATKIYLVDKGAKEAPATVDPKDEVISKLLGIIEGVGTKTKEIISSSTSTSTDQDNNNKTKEEEEKKKKKEEEEKKKKKGDKS